MMIHYEIIVFVRLFVFVRTKTSHLLIFTKCYGNKPHAQCGVGLPTGGFPLRSLAQPGARVQSKGRELGQGEEIASAASDASTAPPPSLPLPLQLLQDVGWAEPGGGWVQGSFWW